VPDTWAPNGSSALMLAASANGVSALQVCAQGGWLSALSSHACAAHMERLGTVHTGTNQCLSCAIQRSLLAATCLGAGLRAGSMRTLVQLTAQMPLIWLQPLAQQS
jgi:hypothetical protein